MKHYTQDELVLLHYGERSDADEVRGHLEECGTCAAEYKALTQLLESVEPSPVPERAPAYPAEVWSRVHGRLEQEARPAWATWVSWPRLALAASLAALLVVAFVVGHDQGRQTSIGELSAADRERLLMFSVAEHLESSRRMLVELGNSDVSQGVDLQERRPRAARLAYDNRIYRTTAASAGHDAVADLLEVLERVLQEIANGPETLDANEYNRLWRRIESSALLIKMRIVESESQNRMKSKI